MRAMNFHRQCGGFKWEDRTYEGPANTRKKETRKVFVALKSRNFG